MELCKRLEIVCGRLGHEYFASSSIRDAHDSHADYIFAMHYETAKVSPIFTVGLVWNPLAFMRQVEPRSFIKTLTLDAHLYGSESLRTYFSSLSDQGHRTTDLGNFYPSAEKTSFVPMESFGLPTYIGVLWQDSRHRDLFSILNDENAINGYGSTRGWARFKKIFRGGFAIDGNSFQTIYRRSGIGLCLHSDDHLREGIPAMRIFEIVASGCIAICDEHPFVRQTFGDTVYYLDSKKSPRETASQIADIVEQVRSKPARSREMAEAAHCIFNENLSLDHLLTEAIEKMAPCKTNRMRSGSSAPARVQIITRTAGARPKSLRRALQSVAGQTHQQITSIILYHGPDLEKFTENELPLLRSEFPKLCIEFTHVPAQEPLSETVPAALRGSQADFIGFLDDDDWYYPEHVQTLVEALQAHPQKAVAVSGAAVDWERSLNSSTSVPVSSSNHDSSELLSFEPLDWERLKQGEINICFGMLLLRRSSLPEKWTDWPRVNLAEDRALVVLLLQKNPECSVFTSRVSCTWTYRHLQNENQIDLVLAPDTSTGSRGFIYKPLNLPYLEVIKGDRRYHTSSLRDKCLAAGKTLTTFRWAPRRVRPLLYQKRLNLLFLSIMEELSQLGVLGIGGSSKLAELDRFNSHAVGGIARQRDFNKLILEMLRPQHSAADPVSQHAINLMITRELDRQAKVF